MSAMDRSELRTSWAASRRNSSGYFDGLPNGDSFLRTATAAHYQVSTRPGQDQVAPVPLSKQYRQLIDSEAVGREAQRSQLCLRYRVSREGLSCRVHDDRFAVCSAPSSSSISR